VIGDGDVNHEGDGSLRSQRGKTRRGVEAEPATMSQAASESPTMRKTKYCALKQKQKSTHGHVAPTLLEERYETQKGGKT
jgi:hypothetical protein